MNTLETPTLEASKFAGWYVERELRLVFDGGTLGYRYSKKHEIVERAAEVVEAFARENPERVADRGVDLSDYVDVLTPTVLELAKRHVGIGSSKLVAPLLERSQVLMDSFELERYSVKAHDLPSKEMPDAEREKEPRQRTEQTHEIPVPLCEK